MTSTRTPPKPHTTAGPNRGSLFTPRIISVPPATMRCTSTPSRRAAGARRRTSREHLADRPADRGGVGAADVDAADVGLVRDVGRVDLEHHGVAQTLGGAHGLVRVLRGQGVGHGNPELAEQAHGLGVPEHAAPGAASSTRGGAPCAPGASRR